MRLHFLAFALALAAAAPAAGAPAAAPSFDYDANVIPPPPGLGSETAPAPGVVARQMDYFLGDRRVQAEMIYGAGPGPHPAVLFVHWLGDPPTTNHTEFEADAVALAKLGVTSMLIDAPWSQGGWFDPLGRSADADLRDSAQTVIELRRCLDTLLASSDVDPHRVAYVGHDFGAMFGMLMASVDRRPSWYVFMAPNSSMGEWYLWGKKTPDRAAYLARLSALNPPRFLARAHAKGILLQFSAHDEYITAAHRAAMVAATPSAHVVKVYDADHSLETPAAHADRLAWLKARLLAPH